MDLNALMQQYMAGPSMADQEAAKRKAIMAASLGLLASAPSAGKGWGGAARALGRGGLLGMGAYDQAMGEASNKGRAQLQDMSALMDFQTKKQAYDDDQTYRGAMKDYTPQAPSMPTLPSMAPTHANAAALASTPKPGAYEQQMQLVEYLKQRKVPQQYIDQQIAKADKLRPQYDTTPRIGRDAKTGEVYQFILDKDGNERRLNAGAAEKLHFANTGGQAAVGFDPYSGKQVSGGAAVTMDPAQIDASKRGWAGVKLDQEKFGYQQTRDKAKDARATAAPGGDGAEKPLTESQATAALYLGMMDSAERELGKLKHVTPTDVMLARGEGPWVAKPIQNLVASKDAQKYAQASFQWAEAMLRATTGATAPPEEVKRTAATFFPQINDSPEVIKQKEAMRKQMQTLMAIKAGKAGASQARGAVEAQASVVPQSIAQMSNEAILEALR